MMRAGFGKHRQRSPASASDVASRVREDGPSVLEFRLACGDKAKRFGIEPMLCAEHARRQGRFGITGHDGNLGLGDDRTGVEFSHDEMHGAAGYWNARFQNALMHFQPLERRQEGGMNVENPPLPFAHESGRVNAHETSFADERDLSLRERGIDRIIEGLARGEASMRDDFNRNTRVMRDRDAGSRFHIRNNKDDLGRIVGRAGGGYERGKVAASAGNQDCGTNTRRH